MKILIICHELPFPGTTSALTYRVLNAVKHLSKKYMHNITIVGFKYKEDPEEYLKKYCNEILTITLPTSFKKRIVYYFLNYIIGIFLGYVSRKNIFDFRFSWKLQKIIRRLLKTKEFDMVFVADDTFKFNVFSGHKEICPSIQLICLLKIRSSGRVIDKTEKSRCSNGLLM